MKSLVEVASSRLRYFLIHTVHVDAFWNFNTALLALSRISHCVSVIVYQAVGAVLTLLTYPSGGCLLRAGVLTAAGFNSSHAGWFPRSLVPEKVPGA